MAGRDWVAKGWNRGLLSLSLLVVLSLGNAMPGAVDAPGDESSASVQLTGSSAAGASAIVELAARPEAPASRVEVEESTRSSQRQPERRSLPGASPESVGMDGSRLASLDATLNGYIEDGLFPGAVVLVARRGVVVKHAAYGNAAVWESEGVRLAQPVPMTTETLFDVASLTKVFTATAALTLVDQGRLDLDAPVVNYLPEFADGGKSQVTVRQLLAHTAGLPPGLKLWTRGDTLEARLASAMALATKVEPGSQYEYSDAGPIFVALLVERITGRGYGQYLKDAVLAPLGAGNTEYNPSETPRERIAATEVLKDGQTGVNWGTAHDGEARALNGVAGNAGLFSTASDVALLGQMMLGSGAATGGQILSPAAVAEAVRPQPGTDGKRGIGWEIGQGWYMGKLASPSTFGHTGFTGTSLVVDPRSETVVVLLTNSLHPHAKGSTNPARRAVADAVKSAILR